MSAQTTYDLNQSKGYAGQVANNAVNNIVTGVVGAGTVLPGIFVSRTASAESAPTTFNKGANYVVAAGGATDPLGVAVRDLGREGAPNTAAISYEVSDQLPVMRGGYIYLTIPSGGSHGDRIKYTTATGVIDAGAPAVGETGIDGARLEVDTAAGGVGLVWIPAVTSVTAGA